MAISTRLFALLSRREEGGIMIRRVVSMIVAFCFLPVLCFAAPHLVCDPQTNVTHYVITGDITVTLPATDLGDGTFRLELDLSGIATRTYNIEVTAKNIWGESVAVPFVFTKGLPAASEGIRIE